MSGNKKQTENRAKNKIQKCGRIIKSDSELGTENITLKTNHGFLHGIEIHSILVTPQTRHVYFTLKYWFASSSSPFELI
jgi:hypothetical protein